MWREEVVGLDSYIQHHNPVSRLNGSVDESFFFIKLTKRKENIPFPCKAGPGQIVDVTFSRELFMLERKYLVWPAPP